MAQVITRCRLTGHYMFMGLDVDPKEFARSPGPFKRKFCPFCACDHLWHKEDSNSWRRRRRRVSAFSKRADGDIGRVATKACADDLPAAPSPNETS